MFQKANYLFCILVTMVFLNACQEKNDQSNASMLLFRVLFVCASVTGHDQPLPAHW